MTTPKTAPNALSVRQKPTPEKDPAPSEFDEFLNEAFGANERAGAIVAVAHVEDTLERAIKSKFRELSADDCRSIFESLAAPLSTLHAKIHVGYALSLYSRGARADLLALKDVRNIFAHRKSVRAFSHPDVSAICARLSYPLAEALEEGNSEDADPQERFQSTVGALFLGLGLLATGTDPKIIDGLGSLVLRRLEYPARPAAPPASPRTPRVRPSKGAPG